MERKIDYVALLNNVNEMILLLEFDSMRSAGKCKLNADTIDSLYRLKDRYTKMIPVKTKKEDK